MKNPFFIIEGQALKKGVKIKITDQPLIHQMQKVLRFKVGQKLNLLDGNGLTAESVLLCLSKKIAELEIVNVLPKKDAGPPFRLFCAIAKKPATFELIIQKAVELGINEIHPIWSARTQAREIKNTKRMEAIIKEACEQSEQVYLPKLYAAQDLQVHLADLPEGLNFVAQERGENVLKLEKGQYGSKAIRDLCKSFLKLEAKQLSYVIRAVSFSLLRLQKSFCRGLRVKHIGFAEGSINIFIGPEGGWSNEENLLFSEKNMCTFTMGENILRMETAAISAISLIRFS